MGQTQIWRTGTGKNIRDAWNDIQKQDREEFGKDLYNGGANNCNLIADLSGKINPKDLEDEAEKRNVDKREVYGVCVQKPILNKNKVKTHVDRRTFRGKRQWLTVYKVLERYSGDQIAVKNTLKEAIEAGRKHTEKTKMTTRVLITKELQSDPICAVITYKKAATERMGIWNFYGYAPE